MRSWARRRRRENRASRTVVRAAQGVREIHPAALRGLEPGVGGTGRDDQVLTPVGVVHRHASAAMQPQLAAADLPAIRQQGLHPRHAFEADPRGDDATLEALGECGCRHRFSREDLAVQRDLVRPQVGQGVDILPRAGPVRPRRHQTQRLADRSVAGEGGKGGDRRVVSPDIDHVARDPGGADPTIDTRRGRTVVGERFLAEDWHTVRHHRRHRFLVNRGWRGDHPAADGPAWRRIRGRLPCSVGHGALAGRRVRLHHVDTDAERDQVAQDVPTPDTAAQQPNHR